MVPRLIERMEVGCVCERLLHMPLVCVVHSHSAPCLSVRLACFAFCHCHVIPRLSSPPHLWPDLLAELVALRVSTEQCITGTIGHPTSCLCCGKAMYEIVHLLRLDSVTTFLNELVEPVALFLPLGLSELHHHGHGIGISGPKHVHETLNSVISYFKGVVKYSCLPHRRQLPEVDEE